MAEKLLFELVSPERLLVSEEVEMVVVRGSDGFFGALPRHAPLITGVLPGVVDVYQDGSVTNRIFVTSGFAEANEAGCTVLAEEAFPLSELTSEMVQARVASARKAIEEASDDASRNAAENALSVALSMESALSGSAAH